MAVYMFGLLTCLLLSVFSLALARPEPNLEMVTSTHQEEEACEGGNESTLEAHSKLGASITQATTKQKKEIKTLVAMWGMDTIDLKQGQGTWYKYKPDKKTEWRIDNQSNGPFDKFKDGTLYYNLAVQTGRSVYASAIVPGGVDVGMALIQNTFIASMDSLKVAVIKKVSGEWTIVLETK